MPAILEAWDGFSLMQKICSCATVALVFAAFLYVPYYVPTTRSYEYGWIWRPVTYEDPLTKNVLDQISPEELEDKLREDGITFDPQWRKNSTQRNAFRSLRRAERNAMLVVVLGVVLHFAVGAVEQVREHRAQEAE